MEWIAIWQNHGLMPTGQVFTLEELFQKAQREAIAACRAAVEKQLIHGALSLQGKTAMDQADAVLAAIDAVEVR